MGEHRLAVVESSIIESSVIESSVIESSVRRDDGSVFTDQ
jgi:hypothetical protein